MIDKERLKNDESYRDGVTDGLATGVLKTASKVQDSLDNLKKEVDN